MNKINTYGLIAVFALLLQGFASHFPGSGRGEKGGV